MNIVENSLAQNRAEELGYDLWDDFVVPPYYDSLDLLTAKKPRVVVGGRGCGKTSLLRYLCHQTQFSIKRKEIDINALESIGIYWRVDTQFAKILSGRGIESDLWNRAFEHLSVLMMSQEIIKSLESIANSNFKGFGASELDELDFSILTSFTPDVPKDFANLKKFIRMQINSFQTWAGSIRTLSAPIFLPLKFVKEIIAEIKEQKHVFNNTIYHVYVDEYENLLFDQQRLINTWVKHSEMPLIFNLAMKPHSFKDKNTIGNEPIAETHDYREYDLEKYATKINFEVFAAEILFLRLWKDNKNLTIPIVPEELKLTDKLILDKRRSDVYKKTVIDVARNFLPGVSIEEIASSIFTDKILLKRLTDQIDKALLQKGFNRPIKKFLLPDFPPAGIIIPALINRGVTEEELLKEISLLKSGKDNKFTGKTNWIHNNAFGCLLLTFEPLGRFCPLYSGFEAFCLMSRTNLRHFLELCYKSITNERLKAGSKSENSISYKSQADASKQASSTFLREIKNFGNDGNKLHTFVLRLGTYFQYSHKKANQSEPEQNHFTIKGDRDEKLNTFLDEAVKWSVLYESRITKQKGGKNSIETEDFEYILNPIYAPYFHISYRKKRSVQFNIEDLNTIAFGNVEDFQQFMTNAAKKWKLIPSDLPIDLFSILDN